VAVRQLFTTQFPTLQVLMFYSGCANSHTAKVTKKNQHS